MKNLNHLFKFEAVTKIRLFAIILTAFGASLSFHSFAQSAGGVIGKVIDSASKLPLYYATVSVYKTGDEHPLKGTTTNDDGAFVINGLPIGKYHLKIELVGYNQKLVNEVNVSASANILGNILLNPVPRQLEAITITAKTPVVESKIDKLVYNAANDLTSQGGVALDVLRKVPMISVDADGNVELQGNSNVRFLINGRASSIFGASLADALQTIPASQIKSIEVITSPGAKYDLEGTAGIVNIVLKQIQKDGFNGNVNLTAGTRLQNGSFNVNTRKGNFGINAFFSGTDQLNSTAITSFNRKSFNASHDTITGFNQNGHTALIRSGYQSGIGLDWNITPKDELSSTFSLNNNLHTENGPTMQNLQTLSPGGCVFSKTLSQQNSSSKQIENAADWSLVYKKTFKKEDQELDILYSSTKGRNHNNISQITNYLGTSYPVSGSRSNNPGKDNEVDISADYSQRVSKTFSLQTGVKATMEYINNDVVTDTLLDNGIYSLNEGQSNSFIFKRNVYAAYLSSTFKLFRGFLEGEAGMRYERTITNSDFIHVNIPGDNLFAPALVLQHTLNESQSVKFSYSYRVQRPEYDDLNPFLAVINSHEISTGNPLLKNEIGHKYEFAYSKLFTNNDNLSLGVFYNYNSNDIQNITTYYPVYNINGTNYYDLSLDKSTNIGSQTTYGATLSGSLAITDQLNLRSDVLLRELVNALPGQTSVSGLCYEISANGTYQILSDVAAELFGNYTSRRIEFKDSHPALLFYTVAIKKQFKDKRASIGITASNPFNRYVNQLSTNYGSDFTQNELRRVPLRSFGLTISYKFGKTDTKKKDEQEEKQQVPAL